MWYVLQDIDQDRDGVRGMFIRKVDGQFCESDVALYRSCGLSSCLVSSCQRKGGEEARAGTP